MSVYFFGGCIRQRSPLTAASVEAMAAQPPKLRSKLEFRLDNYDERQRYAGPVAGDGFTDLRFEIDGMRLEPEIANRLRLQQHLVNAGIRIERESEGRSHCAKPIFPIKLDEQAKDRRLFAVYKVPSHYRIRALAPPRPALMPPPPPTHPTFRRD